MKAFRRRPYLGAIILATIALGLASRKFPGLLPSFLGKYPGDALWAQLVYWLIAFIAPSASITKVSSLALAIAYLDEISQLYQAEWINSVRANSIGHLLLGQSFSWWDMLAYTIGISICVAVDFFLFQPRQDHPVPRQFA